MVIKDVLKKLNSSDPNDPKVAALREKLAKMKQQSSPAKEPSSDSKTQSPKKAQPTQQPKPAQYDSDDELSKLQKASQQEQRAFAQEQNPTLKIKEEKTHKLVTKQVGELIELVTDMGKRIQTLEKEKSQTKQHIERLEKHNKDLNEKMEIIDGRLEKFMSLYEIITNKYNPFSDKQSSPANDQEVEKKPPVPQKDSTAQQEAKVQVTDELTGQKQDVSFEQGSMSSENKQKIDQLLQELEAQEQGESELELDEQDEVQEQEEKVSVHLKSELHELFSSFEQRMKSHVDQTVQQQLHETLSGLEETLDEEVDEAVNEDVASLREDEDIISNALLELQELSEKSSTPEEYSKDEQELEEVVHSIDDQIRAIPESLYFRLHDGRILKSADDLHDALKSISPKVFTHHVTANHNDFADWLELALNDSRGQELRGKSREEMLAVFETHKNQ